MGISKWIMTNSPGSVGSLVRKYSEIFLSYSPSSSVKDAMGMTYVTFQHAGLQSGLIKEMPIMFDIEALIDETKGCLACFMFYMVFLCDDMRKAIQMGGSMANDALEVIYEQTYKAAPRYVKNSKAEFMKIMKYQLS